MICGNYRGGMQIYETGLSVGGGTPVAEIPSVELAVFPNPAGVQDRIRIQGLNEEYGPVRLEISDNLGRIIFSKVTPLNGEGLPHDLIPGQYQIRCYTDQRLIGQARLLVVPN